jgi:hypothetical protein
MKDKSSVILTLAVLISIQAPVQGQEPQRGDPRPTEQASTQTLKPAIGFGLEDGTPIRMRITRTLSSADAKVDDKVDFEILDDIKIGAVTVIPRGGIAWGTVTEAQPKRRMGRAGKLNVNIDAVRLADGERAALRAVKEVQGGNHTGAMTGAIVATSIIFFPAAPLFLFMHGKDITIPKGTEITAYVNGDIVLDPVKFASNMAQTQMQPIPAPAAPADAPVVLVAVQPAPGSQPASALQPPSSSQPAGQPPTGPQPTTGPQPKDTSTVTIKSTPDGADITIDGRFAGSTPSTVKLGPGDHTILIEKSGFKSWQRTLTVGPSSTLNLDATLEKPNSDPGL